MRLRLATVVGGMSIGRQADALRGGAEVVVATPGRLKDLIERGDCLLDEVAVTVLDEADQMADMGFLPQVTELLDQVAPGGQPMLFSATLDRNVDRLVRRFLTDPVTHSVDPSAGTVSTMEHHLLHVQPSDKNAADHRIAARNGGVIMFRTPGTAPTGWSASCWPAECGRRPCTAASPSRSAPAPWSSSATARSPR